MQEAQITLDPLAIPELYLNVFRFLPGSSLTHSMRVSKKWLVLANYEAVTRLSKKLRIPTKDLEEFKNTFLVYSRIKKILDRRQLTVAKEYKLYSFLCVDDFKCDFLHLFL